MNPNAAAIAALNSPRRSIAMWKNAATTVIVQTTNRNARTMNAWKTVFLPIVWCLTGQAGRLAQVIAMEREREHVPSFTMLRATPNPALNSKRRRIATLKNAATTVIVQTTNRNARIMNAWKTVFLPIVWCRNGQAGRLARAIAME
jgi:CBS domain containing-hemolysin-like protein